MRICPTFALCLSATLAAATAAAADTIGGAPDLPPRRPDVVQLPQSGLRAVQPLDHMSHTLPTLGGSDGGAAADAAVDGLMGVLPGQQAAQGARHIYVDENGDLACVTLDTFFPEPC